jgi:mono/diheme cytochrome c family protein
VRIPRSRLLGPPALVEGQEGGRFVDRGPLPLTRELLVEGRRRFEIHCAACHGLVGDGVSRVAADMTLRRPPSLLEASVRGFPDGRVYAAIARGYGLMPAYARDLDVAQRWAVVAYVRALQRSQAVPLADLPPALRAEAGRWLP